MGQVRVGRWSSLDFPFHVHHGLVWVSLDAFVARFESFRSAVERRFAVPEFFLCRGLQDYLFSLPHTPPYTTTQSYMRGFAFLGSHSCAAAFSAKKDK